MELGNLREASMHMLNGTVCTAVQGYGSPLLSELGLPASVFAPGAKPLMYLTPDTEPDMQPFSQLGGPAQQHL